MRIAKVKASGRYNRRSAFPGLLDRRADLDEFRAECKADAVDGSDDHDADAARNEGIFDGGSTALIVDKSCQ